MKIHEADSDDAASIVEDLWLPFAREMETLDDYNTLTDDPRSAAIAHREEKLSAETYCTLLAVEDGEFVGFTSGEIRPSAPVFERGATLAISEAYVRPEWRQRGVASELLAALESWGDEQGYETASLSVNANNRAAIALYESLGFEIRRHRMVKTPD